MINFPRYSFASLFICLIFVGIVYPFIPKLVTQNILLKASFSILLVSSVYIFSHNKKALVICLLLAIPTAISSWLAIIRDVPEIVLILDNATNVVFFLYVIFELIKIIFSASVVTRNIIYGAMSIYLLLGIMWAFVYALLDLLIIDAFGGSSYQSAHDLSQFIYFSYVTLTTLGYGDMMPLAGPVQSIAAMEAITGQFFLTILVARLVGMHISQTTNGNG
ncbi:ion channel [Spartinivicinus poritis]|uniref:Ion channel n=1 Tax=Spartinivicinus poritis TaxID=2994640 RepID=A0ABT5U8I6_9GAMM|nr:ion channel [Spartinivicinus sp. A2-2]MDE1462316.1 ion channel [Spartinivicinus sp. A2-2]